MLPPGNTINHRHPMKYPTVATKTPSQSLTIKGAGFGILSTVLAALISLLFGIKIPADQLNDMTQIIGSIPADWGALVLAFLAMWARITKWDFDKSRLASKTFWLSLLAAIMAVLGVIGVDTAALSEFGSAVVVILGKYLPTLAFILSTIGAVRAKKAIEV